MRPAGRQWVEDVFGAEIEPSGDVGPIGPTGVLAGEAEEPGGH
jgi:hypothetical protein